LLDTFWVIVTMDKYSISPYSSILDALRAIDDSAIAVAVVCEEDGTALGVLTDGNLRRALIGGADLLSSIEPYVSRDFISVARSDVLELMQAHLIEQVPILDDSRKLIGIHTLHSILGAELKPNWAVIMAGGKGTRLGKLTDKTPKPMLKVAGKPILERLVLHLISYGIRRIFLSVNHLSDVIEDHFGDGSEWGCQISYLYEDTPLGSGGALSLLPELPKCPLILLNGDLVFEGNISQLLSFHEKGDYFATMGVRSYSHEIPFGCVETVNRRITKLEEKPLLTKTINGGVYVFSPKALETVPKATFFPVTKIFEEALESGTPCGAYFLEGNWIDVGVPEQLDRARGVTNQRS
jgi:dTDP-glucose pyrophosphorylase/predicted transcriptional regulator